ncbi:hypothetical protein [Pseudomonas atacamensis]|uniref:hypothetical protein n=1 Tax=Pseudomonas atacamensis TaxID=2565368 RepID=UPI0038578AEC
MAKKISPDAIRRKMSADLLELAQVLTSGMYGVIVNPDVLKSSANTITRQTKGSTWAYKISGLLLRVDVPQSTQPVNCPGPLTIEVGLSLGGDFESEEDQLTDLILDILIRSSCGTHLCAWHFDRHIEGGNAPLEAHPLYHFQHGGNAMLPFAGLLGNSLLLPAPRLAFPPMDAVLAIDFVLSNFSGECWSFMRKQPTYLRLIRESQKLLWKPYLQRLANWWDTPQKEERKKAISLMPHLA